MNKKIKIITLFVAVCCLFLGNLSIVAAEDFFVEMPNSKTELVSKGNEVSPLSNPTLTACNLGIGISSSGLAITFDTTASHIADEIGVRNIVLQEKTWYGGWKDIPVSNYCSYNSDFYSGGVVYTAATKGTTYRVKCTHYAKFGSTELTLDNTSSELTYN